jgi:hypothetical protein
MVRGESVGTFELDLNSGEGWFRKSAGLIEAL